MQNIKYICIYVFTTFIIISCTNKKNSIEFNIDDFQKTFTFNSTKAKRIILTPEKVHGNFTSFIVKDSLLLAGSSYGDKLLNIYSLNTGKLINKIISRGTSSQEGLSVGSLYFQDDSEYSLWLYDITFKKLFKINLLDVITKSPNYIPEQEIKLSADLKNMIYPKIINDSTIIATTYASEDFRYFYTDGKKIIKKIGNLPIISNDEKLINDSNSKIPNKTIIFKAFAVKHPLQNKIAVFYNKTDRIEFYNNDKLTKIIQSKDSFNPIMKISEHEGEYSVEDSEDTRFAYLSLTYNNTYIFALYSGKANWQTTSNRIYVFDWNGNFVHQFILDKYISDIFLDSKNNTLYCYGFTTKEIFSTKLKF